MDELTEETEKVLASVHVTECLASMIAMTGLGPLMDVVELWALESVEEDAAKSTIEVLLDTGDDLFEEVGIGRSWSAVGTLGTVVVL